MALVRDLWGEYDDGHPEVPQTAGKARLELCPACQGYPPGGQCDDCYDMGYRLWHACIACGSENGWYFLNGMNDRQGMRCRDCPAAWQEDDPAWREQVLPAWVSERLAQLGISR
jgi:hypothetical protein